MPDTTMPQRPLPPLCLTAPAPLSCPPPPLRRQVKRLELAKVTASKAAALCVEQGAEDMHRRAHDVTHVQEMVGAVPKQQAAARPALVKVEEVRCGLGGWCLGG